MMCKDNYAATVSQITPHRHSPMEQICWINGCKATRWSLDGLRCAA